MTSGSRATAASYAALALVAALIIWNGIGQALVRTNPALARLPVGDEVRQVALARLALAQAERRPQNKASALADAKRHARAAMERSPLTPGAYGALAYAEALGGERVELGRLAAAQPHIGWRDRLALVGTLLHAAQRQDADAAAATLDVFMRTSHTTDPQVFALLAGLAADPQFRGEMVSILKERPHWRRHFLYQLGEQPKLAPVAAGLIDALIGARVKLDADEVASFFWVNRYNLPSTDQYRRWKAIFMPGVTDPGPMRDGRFDRISGPPPFSWRMPRDGGLSARIEVDAAGGGHGLVVTSDGMQDMVATGQQLLLAPGKWSLNAILRTETNSGAPQAIAVRVSCGGAQVLIAQQEFRVGAADSNVNIAIAVPSTNCASQNLEIVALRSAENYPYSLMLRSVSIKRIS